ncbi:MAG: hypothetical protein KDE56_27215, partial [Anaerolineales bacterium]|nr:hypothetical protein [Anaerolineales bacterium]
MVEEAAEPAEEAASEDAAAPKDEEAATDEEMADEEEMADVAFDNSLLDTFDATNFENSATIDNNWLPLVPGTHWVYEGTTTEDGEAIAHRIEFTMTDLVKEVAGVQTAVAFIEDYAEDELVEAEIAFYAQDKEGTVWYLGEYPEEYENGEFVKAPAWITGIDGAKAGIKMWAKPEMGMPDYPQGWGPAVEWTDRGQIDQMGQDVCVPVECYSDVIIVREFTWDAPTAFQLKYHAPGVGDVKVSWEGDDQTQEELELTEFTHLDADSMAEFREKALMLEEHAYERSKDVYGQTEPAVPAS